MRRVRCAIYTRKSSEEGLEQDFNSLDAQREACAAFIASQRHEGWELLPEAYDDGGLSGGNLERPALKRLMAAVDAKQVDQIVVYKIDRLTRSLADFAKLVDRLDAAQTSFVSVTQSFNTATSMGRLTLNMLLSFAQFEREVTAERIRDKIAASKRKGMWMGGCVPLGYDPDGRTLKINHGEAQVIRRVYDLYLERGSLRLVREQAEKEGLRSKQRLNAEGKPIGGQTFDQGRLQHLLSNPIYAGRIRHKTEVYPGQHPAIIDPSLWDKVQEMLKDGARVERGQRNSGQGAPLQGKLFDETGERLTPSHSKKGGKRFRYYVSRRLLTEPGSKHPEAWRLPADQFEQMLADALRERFAQADAALKLTKERDAPTLKRLTERLREGCTTPALLSQIERVDLRQGVLKVALNTYAIAELLDCEVEAINPDALEMEVPFLMRRRGVELKLTLGAASPDVDQTLVENIVKARDYLSRVIAGATFVEIAADEGVSKRRIQDLTNLALLAPDVIEDIIDGKSPVGLTSDYLIKTRFSAEWSKQRAQFAELK